MTREEAIKILKAWDLNYDEEYSAHEFDIAFKMAIEALKRCQRIDNRIANAKKTDWVRKGFTDEEVKEICDEARENARKALQTGPCEDAISRHDAKLHIEKRLYESGLNNVGYQCDASDVFKDIAENRLAIWLDELPSVNPKNVGRWIKNTDRNGKLYGWYHCSECGAVIGTPESAKYCSECGSYNAKMEEGDK